MIISLLLSLVIIKYLSAITANILCVLFKVYILFEVLLFKLYSMILFPSSQYKVLLENIKC